MSAAFILINVEAGSERTVLSELKRIVGVKEGFLVAGICDIILRVEMDSMHELRNIIFLKVRRVDRIRSTVVLLYRNGT